MAERTAEDLTGVGVSSREDQQTAAEREGGHEASEEHCPRRTATRLDRFKRVPIVTAC